MRVETAHDGAAVVHLERRLDAAWSALLADTLDDLLRAGTRSVIVDLSEVSYVSSAGMRAITRSAEDFGAVRGELLVRASAPHVRDALGHAGLADRLLAARGETADPREPTGERSLSLEQARLQTTSWHLPTTVVPHGHFEVSPRDPGAALACRVHGAPIDLAGPTLGARDCRVVPIGERSLGVAIGAIGDDFDECHARIGEVVVAASAVIHLPTDGDGVPDYQLAPDARAVPTLLASGLICEGGFSHLVRFGISGGSPSVPLAELADVCLDAVHADVAGLAMVVETTGLVGATLRRSPTLPTDEASGRTGATHGRLGFTAEPAYEGTTALVAGVVARRATPPLTPHLRPLHSRTLMLGHLHAVVFSYWPVPRRTMAPMPVVMHLLQHRTARAVLHLLHDEREGVGAGESTFSRGLAWISPIAEVVGA